MKKKIGYFIEDGRVSGPTVQIRNISKNLKKYNQKVFFFKYQSENFQKILRKEKVYYKTLSTRYLSSNIFGLFFYFIDFIFSFKNIFNEIKKENFDLVFINGSSQFKFLIICKLLKLKMVWFINDAKSGYILKFLISYLSLFPKCVIFVSKNSKNFYYPYFKKRSPIILFRPLMI